MLRAELDPKLQRLRQAVASHVTPSPYYDLKILWGPVSEIGLEEDRCVVAIYVPMSTNTPHVHKSGVIYRRVGDASEPIAETDRFFLDQLWRRSEELTKEYKDFLDKEPLFTDNERRLPFIRLVMLPDPWRNHELHMNLSISEARATMNVNDSPVSSLPFNTVHTRAAGGFIARQADAGNDPHFLGLTWRFWPDAVSDVLIPLNVFEADDATELESLLQGYSCAKRFANAMKTQRHQEIRAADFNYLLSVLVGAINIQERLHTKVGWNGAIFAKMHILNAGRVSPFIDVTSVLEDFEKFGIPICFDDKIEIPPGSDPESFFEVPTHSEVLSPESRVLARAWHLFDTVARAFGIPLWLEGAASAADGTYFEQVVNATLRVKEHQRLRAELARRG